MACGSCAGNRKRATDRYEWTSEPDENGATTTQVYTGKYAEIQASAKAKRKGGTFAPLPAPVVQES